MTREAEHVTTDEAEVAPWQKKKKERTDSSTSRPSVPTVAKPKKGECICMCSAVQCRRAALCSALWARFRFDRWLTGGNLVVVSKDEETFLRNTGSKMKETFKGTQVERNSDAQPNSRLALCVC